MELNARQTDVLRFVCKGLRNREIADLMGLKERTVKGYVAQLLLIFDVTNRTELVGLFANPDGSLSPDYDVFINEPYETVLQSGYPSDGSWPGSANGFITTYQWTMGDSCGYGVSNVDANEVFGTFTNDTTTNWSYPTADALYWSTTTAYDYLGEDDGTIPMSTNPQVPLSSQKVRHDYPWNLYLGSQTFGSGVSVRADTQQWYVDHGRHQ